jgi:hypothetical protein
VLCLVCVGGLEGQRWGFESLRVGLEQEGTSPPSSQSYVRIGLCRAMMSGLVPPLRFSVPGRANIPIFLSERAFVPAMWPRHALTLEYILITADKAVEAIHLSLIFLSSRQQSLHSVGRSPKLCAFDAALPLAINGRWDRQRLAGPDLQRTLNSVAVTRSLPRCQLVIYHQPISSEIKQLEAGRCAPLVIQVLEGNKREKTRRRTQRWPPNSYKLWPSPVHRALGLDGSCEDKQDPVTFVAKERVGSRPQCHIQAAN